VWKPTYPPKVALRIHPTLERPVGKMQGYGPQYTQLSVCQRKIDLRFEMTLPNTKRRRVHRWSLSKARGASSMSADFDSIFRNFLPVHTRTELRESQLASRASPLVLVASSMTASSKGPSNGASLDTAPSTPLRHNETEAGVRKTEGRRRGFYTREKERNERRSYCSPPEPPRLRWLLRR
jgi:hypothetical protein